MHLRSMKVQVINLSNNKLPQYETPMSAGMDIRADFSRVTVDNPIKAYPDWIKDCSPHY